MLTMKKPSATIFALFGNPVGHSLSPFMHNAAYKEMKIDASYVPVCVEHLEDAIGRVRRGEMQGASITIPFKTAVMPYLDEVERSAQKIGAVNMMWHEKNDRLTGHNTDWIGLVRDLEESLEIQNKTFVILGAGGAARAAVFGIQQRGGTPLVINRTPARGEAMARELGCSFYPLSEIGNIRGDCLINTTPVGMSPAKGTSPVAKSVLSNFRWVIDVIYNPVQTQLLKDADEAGCTTLNGVGMFIHQGAEQIKLWTGKEPPREFMKQIVLEKLREDEGN
jgi:shikimate dehydrogenase